MTGILSTKAQDAGRLMVLQDDKGKIWNDYAVFIEAGQWSDGYYRREAENALALKFLEDWLGKRFHRFSPELAREVAIMLCMNGWSFVELSTNPIPKTGDHHA